MAVIFEWAWAYLTWQRGSRVILEIPSENTLPRAGMPSPGELRRRLDARIAVDPASERATTHATVGAAASEPPNPPVSNPPASTPPASTGRAA